MIRTDLVHEFWHQHLNADINPQFNTRSDNWTLEIQAFGVVVTPTYMTRGLVHKLLQTLIQTMGPVSAVYLPRSRNDPDTEFEWSFDNGRYARFEFKSDNSKVDLVLEDFAEKPDGSLTWR